MSYRGRPSKGCESCRARKVRCDETKPVCNRCSKAGHECKYRNQADLLFRNQTAFAAQRAEDSWRKRSKSHQRKVSISSSSNTSSSSNKSSPQNKALLPATSSAKNTSPPSTFVHDVNTADACGMSVMPQFSKLSLTQELSPDIRRLAYERFVYDFVAPESPTCPSDEPSDALWGFLPELYRNAADNSCVVAIIDAVAYTNFAHRCNAPQAEMLAEQSLSTGMTLLAKMIASKQHAASNDALCAVYFLGVYENISTRQRKGSYVTHSHGANALLNLRSVEEYYGDPVSARLYEVAYAQMLVGNLHAGKAPPIPVQNVSAIRKYLPSLYNESGVFVTELIHRETTFHAKWHELKQRDSLPQSRDELRDFLETALKLDTEFQAWESSIPTPWKYQMKPNTPETRSTYDIRWQRLILGSRGAPEEIHSYLTLKRCWIWSFFRTSRIFLLRDTLEILNWMFRLPELQEYCSPDVSDTFHDSSSLGSLQNASLRVHHSFATLHLVNLIEKSCSAILGSFTVPVYGKSFDEVMGMRGYVHLWALGVMDAVLRSGLVPDSQAPLSPQSTYRRSSHPTDFPGGPVLAVSSEDRRNSHVGLPSNPDTFHSLPTVHEIPPMQQYQHQHAVSPVAPLASPTAEAAVPRKTHVFDSNPPHPYDAPVQFPVQEFEIAKPKKIDIAARREWINCLLYYCATDLGIKKGLYVPLTEGLLPTARASVNAALGR